jgi:NAD(P)-dependent dehydrogenase (short-subunit alcohol dehydrogenase family)
VQVLKGKVALITGALRGLACALALDFARRGADLVVNSRALSASGLKDTRHQAEAFGVQVLAVIADVSERADLEPARLQSAYLEAIERGYLWHEFGDMNLIV